MDATRFLLDELARRQERLADLQGRLGALSSAQSERVEHAFALAATSIGDSDLAVRWLLSRPRVLSGLRPIDLVIASDDGASQVGVILGRIEHGVYS
jgi:uncharacterized protein (DUF2384 family)